MLRRVLTGGVLAMAAFGVAFAADGWPQWGGPERDFTIGARKLSRDWGEAGPARLWNRPLGGGFAAIVGDEQRLYTMYREGDDEIVIALDARTGETRWSHRYSAPVPKSPALSTEYGKGPNSTPLLVDGKIVTLGFTGHVHCVSAADGKPAWSHDLGAEFEVKIPYFGHATSPLAVGSNVVIVAGGVFAFDLGSGTLAWKNRELEGSYGSPRLVSVGGKPQIVTPLTAHLAGLDTRTGKTLWTQTLKNEWGTILTSPVLDDAGRIFISAAGAGSILVDPAAESAESRQVWKGDKTSIGHSNSVRAGKWLFASIGDTSGFISATSLDDGSLAWKERGFSQFNLLRVGDDFLLLDFEGALALLKLDGQGMEIVTRAKVPFDKTWTPPTLIGTTLYVRDESRIAALDLAAK